MAPELDDLGRLGGRTRLSQGPVFIWPNRLDVLLRTQAEDRQWLFDTSRVSESSPVTACHYQNVLAYEFIWLK
jgi:hypothetical protein